MLLRCADVAKHEIGPLITNTWPLIFIFHFLFSSSLPAYPSSSVFPSPPPSITSLSPLSPSPSHFPSTRFLFSTVTFSIPHSIFSACPLSFSPDLIIYFFFSHILALIRTSQKFLQSLKNLYCIPPHSNARCHSTPVQLCSDLPHN